MELDPLPADYEMVTKTLQALTGTTFELGLRLQMLIARSVAFSKGTGSFWVYSDTSGIACMSEPNDVPD